MQRAGQRVEVIERRRRVEGARPSSRSCPCALKWGDITLKRGFTDDMKLQEWRNKTVDGEVDDMRKNGSIVI